MEIELRRCLEEEQEPTQREPPGGLVLEKMVSFAGQLRGGKVSRGLETPRAGS